MNYPLPQGLLHSLALADGSRWIIAAGDEEAATIVSRLSEAMQLREASRSGAVEAPDHDIVHRLLVRIESRNPEASPATGLPRLTFENDSFADCVLHSIDHSDGLFVQLIALSSILARDAQSRGAVLLHGALAEKHGIGVLLAAPGGTGKSTASGRLAAPWRSRCDDTTLVVPDSLGNYWAHPWPTWSRFLGEKSGGTGSGGAWDVQNAVPLKGIFFLSRALEDRAESLGPGHGLSMLVECAKQASQLMARGMNIEDTRALHLEQFNNLCALARVVPAHVLRISLTGAFWQEIERTLAGR